MTSNPVIGGRWHNQKRHLVHQRAEVDRQLWSTFSITPPSRALGHVGGGRFRRHATREVCILRQVP